MEQRFVVFDGGAEPRIYRAPLNRTARLNERMGPDGGNRRNRCNGLVFLETRAQPLTTHEKARQSRANPLLFQ